MMKVPSTGYRYEKANEVKESGNLKVQVVSLAANAPANHRAEAWVNFEAIHIPQAHTSSTYLHNLSGRHGVQGPKTIIFKAIGY